MSEQKKYTKQEVINLAEECFPYCIHCIKYNPVHSEKSAPETKLFTSVRNGCCYAYELPFVTKQFCTHRNKKTNTLNKVQELTSLTDDDVKDLNNTETLKTSEPFVFSVIRHVTEFLTKKR